MSNVFTYAIDERNLRIQLKALQAPMREDAWQKFEVYADAHPFQMPSTGFSGLNINLNRNVVLPVVFGLIICLFSFMLFNFISIQDSPEQTTQKAELQVTAATPEIKEVVIPSPQPLPQPKITVKSEPFMKPSAPAVVVEKPAFALMSEIGSSNSTPEGSSMTSNIDQTVASTLEPKPETQTKKSYRKKNKAEEQLMEIRPTPVSDEEEQEVIPN